MATVQEIFDKDLSAWGPCVRFFSTDDGRYFVVLTDPAPQGPGTRFNYICGPTTILLTNDNAHALDLTPDWEFEPETTTEQAIQQAGFTYFSVG